MFESCALPLLEEAAGKSFALCRVIHTYGSPESHVNDRVRDLFRSDPDVNMTILAKTYGIDLRVYTCAQDRELATERLRRHEDEITRRLDAGEIYGYDHQTMQEAVARLLLEKNATVCPAESCTGGLVSKMLTDISGSSAYLKRSYVVYSNEAKSEILGIPAADIEKYGAVSEETAVAMAKAARKLAHADYGIAVTGISGPTGGSAEKPVGLTWHAVASKDGVIAKKAAFVGDREQNRRSAALMVLNMLRRSLLGLAV